MYLRINDNIKIDLPEHYDIDQRKQLCNELIDEYHEYFVYKLPKSPNDMFGENVQRRLSVLATYLYKCVKDVKNDNVLSDYKERRNNIKEIKFSSINNLNI